MPQTRTASAAHPHSFNEALDTCLTWRGCLRAPSPGSYWPHWLQRGGVEEASALCRSRDEQTPSTTNNDRQIDARYLLANARCISAVYEALVVDIGQPCLSSRAEQAHANTVTGQRPCTSSALGSAPLSMYSRHLETGGAPSSAGKACMTDELPPDCYHGFLINASSEIRRLYSTARMPNEGLGIQQRPAGRPSKEASLARAAASHG